MKVIYIECNSEELKANRTVLDNLAEVFSGITEAIGGVDVAAGDDEETEEE